MIYIPPSRGYRYLIIIKNNFSGQVEIRVLKTIIAENIAYFFQKNIIYRHGIFTRLVVNGGPKNKGLIKDLVIRYSIDRVVISVYYLQANSMVEQGYGTIIAALLKLTQGGGSNQVKHLPVVLWADKTTYRASTGITPYEIEYANRAVLPIELKVSI